MDFVYLIINLFKNGDAISCVGKEFRNFGGKGSCYYFYFLPNPWSLFLVFNESLLSKCQF